ncbi:MAG: ATP-binding protein [Sandaracinaceae bacterium]|nr:ATP-binding protein [Sandaracinaceae bacterium]
MYQRALAIADLLRHRSLFLLGPRQTGKSTLLREALPGARFIDLLEADTFREYSARPELLRQTLRPQDHVVVIDEVQKLPALLDEAHGLIERNKKLRFVFTGSSARKLKRGHANLLAGRAWFARLHPLVAPEIGFDRLDDRLNRGGLPSIIDSPAPHEDLRAYVGSYLQEEIRGEGLTRAIEPFSRFLNVAGLSNGELLNFTSIGSDAEVPSRTVREYYQLLEDTLVGHLLPPFRTKSRKAVATAKFFFFDVGVANVLRRVKGIERGSTEYGRALEHQVFLELRAYLDYRRRDDELVFWRTHSGLEVDFVVGGHTAIEVKAAGKVTDRDLRGLRAFAEEVRLERRVIVCGERHERRTEDGVGVLPIDRFFTDLWAGRLL